jgi:chemotaxis protein CheX
MKTITPQLIEEVLDFLATGLGDVFKTMLALETEPASPHGWPAPRGTIIAAVVGFTGEVNGFVYLRVTAAFGRRLASRMLGMPEAELGGEEIVNDVVGELGNMIVGNVKSRLCDSGSRCVLTIPSIVRGNDFSIEPVGSSDRRLAAFRCGGDMILLELMMKHSR